MSYSGLARHVIYPIFEMYGRKGALRHFEELERTQWLSLDEIREMQWRKLRSLLEYAYGAVPFYRRVFKSLNMTPKDITAPDSFRRLPLLDKEDITDNIGDIVSSRYKMQDLVPNSTGGSTGVNLNFFNDRRSVGNVSAVVLRNDRWAGLEIGDKKAALWGSPFDISLQNGLKQKIYNRLFRVLFLSSYNLCEENMSVYARKLVQYKPKVIMAYPSPLYRFAKFLEENGIKGINPRSIISSAEVLYDFQRELIESVFGCRVFNRYGCREFSAIAQECSEHSGMHMNAEHVYVECVEEDGEPAAHGERGELVITDLGNYGMPFIRYRIGDIGVPSDRECDCGRGLPMLEEIEGRAFDVVVGTNGRAVGGTFWTLLLRTAAKGIRQFQVVQESMIDISIKVVTSESFEESQIRALVGRIREYLGEDMKVDFQVVDEIAPGESGKFRFVISKVGH